MKELGLVWNNLNSLQKSQIGNDLFGKDNITTGYAILENYEKLDEVVNSLNNSTGSVNSEFNRYLDSTSGKIQQLKDAILEMWTGFVSSDTTKKVVESLIKLVDTFGNLQGVILLVTTAIMIFKGNAIKGLIIKIIASVKAVGLLGTGLKGLTTIVSANPLGLLLVGITTLIALLGQAKTSADRFNESTQAFSKANDNYNSVQESNDLLNQYDELNYRLLTAQSGTEKFTEVTEELHDVQVKLAEKFPELIDGFDSEGNALVRNTEKVKQAIHSQSLISKREMENAVKSTKGVLEGVNDDFQDYFFEGKLVENVSYNSKKKYFGTDAYGKANNNDNLTYENTYKMYRDVLEAGKTLNKDQNKLYEDSRDKLKEYNEEVSKLYEQTKSLDSVKKFDIFDFEKGEFVNAKTYFQQLQEEAKKLEENSASMTAKIQAYAEQGLTASQISDKLGISLESVTTAMSALGDETEDTKTAMQDLSDSYSDNVNKANLLQDVIEEFKESGGLSLETKDKIFSSGYQDIIQAMGNSDTFLSTMESLLNDCMIEAEGLENKMLSVASSTVNAGEASNDMATNYTYNFNTIMRLINLMEDKNAEELNSLAKQYNIDVKNKEMAENEKAKLVNAILNGMDSSTATMLNGLGQKYGVDVDNFSKAQQAKLALLNKFTQQLAISTQDYSYVSGGKFSELKKQLEKEDKMASGAIPSIKYSTNLSSTYSATKVGTTPVGTTGVSANNGSDSAKSEKDYSVENLDLKDYIENHYKLEDKIRDVQHQQDLLSKSIENTYGKNKVKLQNQYINKLKEEQNLQKQLLNEQKKELSDLQKELKGYNAHFDKNGNIANMTELYYHWITKANSINDSTEEGSNAKKNAQERVKYIKELVDKYRDLQEQIQSTESTFNDLSDSIKDVFQQMSDVCVDAEERIANAITERVNDIYDKNTEALDKLRNKIDKTFEEDDHNDTVAEYQKQLLEIRSSIEDAMKTGNNSLVKQLQEDYENVQKEYSKYMQNYEKDKALEKLDEEQEKIDKQKEEMLSSENLTKMVTQAMTEGFINVNGTIVDLNTLMTDFTKNNTVGMQNLVNETADWNQTLMTALDTMNQLSGINSTLGLNTSFAYDKAMQNSVNKALKNAKTTTNKNLNITSPLVVIENVTSDNYNEIIDKVTSQIYTTLNKTLD